MVNDACFFLKISELALSLDARHLNRKFDLPSVYHKFIMHAEESQPVNADDDQMHEKFPSNLLRLIMLDTPQRVRKSEGSCLITTPNWELWENESGGYLFLTRRQSPACGIAVDQRFSTGEVFSDFSSPKQGGAVLFQGLDLKLYVNWLGCFGDLILHASGVSESGQGYCFAGVSGVGKSTLAEALVNHHAVQILGEDHIILRYIGGHFWVFGSPWHENPAMCAPNRAPLQKLFFLDRQAEVGIHAIKPIEGVQRLLQTALIPYYRPAIVAKILDRLTLLANQVSFFTLNYELGQDMWEQIKTV